MDNNNKMLPIKVVTVDGNPYVPLKEIGDYLYTLQEYFAKKAAEKVASHGLEGLHSANESYEYARAYRQLYRQFAEVETEFELQKMIKEETEQEG